jgi:predicted ester cyclase
MPAAEPSEIVRRWFTDFARRRDDFDDFVHPEMVNHAAGAPLQSGAPAFRRIIEAVIDAAGPDGGYQIDQIVAQDDLVMCMTRWSGLHVGAFLGVPATGRPFAVEQAHLFRVRDGKLVEHWAVRDDLAFMRQVGVR